MKDTQLLQACEPASTVQQSQTSPPDRILVVEDDNSIRLLNTEALIHAGYEVDAAPDGAAAWQALSADSYDLLITDNNMPKISGVELLKHLRAVRMELPVIMATGTLPQEEFDRHPWLQPNATLLKPYTIEQLLRTVKKVLREVDRAEDNLPQFKDGEAKDKDDAPAREPANPARPRPANLRHRILVVDEDRDLRLLYADALSASNYQVDFAVDGVAGWEALQASPYNLLITEHEMPKLTGVELVRKVRAAHMALPVIMATGGLPAHELVRCPSLQLAATLLKPFDVDALLDTVKNVLRATISPGVQVAPPNWQSQPATSGLRL